VLLEVNPGDYVYANVVCLGNYDGDTVYLDLDTGFHGWRRSRNSKGRLSLSYRLLDIDAPELRPLVTRAAGEAARDYLSGLIMGWPLIVKTLEDPDNFGRYLVRIWLPDGTDVNRAMLAAGMAVPYTP
jgi:endonuclease YncB( thermonuclease family)